MRKLLILSAFLLALGCGDKKTGPVVVTAEMEAAQKASEKEAQAAELANRKNQKPTKTPEQEVEEAERNRRR